MAMQDALHVSIDDSELAEFVRSKARSQHTTPDGYVGSLVRAQARTEDMECPLSLVTAPAIAGRLGRLVRDADDTDEEFEARVDTHAKLLSLLP
jgi:hypothetical protein